MGFGLHGILDLGEGVRVRARVRVPLIWERVLG